MHNDPPTPMTVAASALTVKSMPDASEKLIAASCVTPSASRTPDVAPTLTIAPPAVIGRIDAAAAMQRMTSARVGEDPTPSALSNSALPTARVVQQQNRNPLAAKVEREMLA